MVGFIAEPSTAEGGDDHQVSKFRKDLLNSTANFSFADSFLDFDDIEGYFADSPEMIGSDLEKGMEVEDIAIFPKIGSGGLGFDGSNSVFEESKENGEWSDLMVNIKEERVELERELEKVSLIGGLNPVVGDEDVVKSELDCVSEGNANDHVVYELTSGVLNGDAMKNDAVSDRVEIVNVGSGNGNESKRLSDKDESDIESESESESSSSSSSSSSDGVSGGGGGGGDDDDDDDDDDDEEEEEEEKKKKKGEEGMEMKREVIKIGDIEEGEIREGVVGETGDDVELDEEDGDKMVGWSDVDEDEENNEAGKGPIKSKNELEALPPVPAVDITLEPNHQMQPVGAVLSMIGPKVIVEGLEKHNPLNEGSILWITEKRAPLGIVDEIFGPVKNPYYVVRYNSESEVPSDINNGTLVSFVPEFANHVLSDKNVYKKGYDASGENDEEEPEELEFSDDEKEAEYYRMLKMSKRRSNDQTSGKKRDNKKKGKNWEGNWKNNNPSGAAPTNVGQVQPNQNPHNVSAARPSMSYDAGSSSTTAGQDFNGRAGFAPPFAPSPGVFMPPNGVWMNGAPGFQRGFPQMQSGLGTFPSNMQWSGQNHLQQPSTMSMPNGLAVQQQFNLNPGQGGPPMTILPGGQPNFYPQPGLQFNLNPSWQAAVGQNYFNQAMGFQFQPGGSPATNAVNFVNQGVIPSNLQQSGTVTGNTPAPQQFNPGVTSSHRGSRPFHRGGRGGRGAGGRGRGSQG